MIDVARLPLRAHALAWCSIFRSPRYWIHGWLQDGVRDGDASLLGKVSVIVFGGGFQLIPRLLGNRIEDVSGRIHAIRVWRLRDAPVSLFATAGGPHYVEAVLSILCWSSVRLVYAMGWCGALTEELNTGDVIVAYAAVRGDATSDWYVERGYPAVADPVEAFELAEALGKAGLRTRLGIVYTTSSHMNEKEVVKTWRDKALCVECELATLYTILSLAKIPVAAALVVSDSLVRERKGGREVWEVSRKLIRILVEHVARKSRHIR